MRQKELYAAPEAEIFEVQTEGVICESLTSGALNRGNDYEGGDDPFAD